MIMNIIAGVLVGQNIADFFAINQLKGKENKMADKRKRENEAPGLWDYRRAKVLLDILATMDNSKEEFDLDTALIQLCRNWGLSPKYYLDKFGQHDDFIDTEETIHILAKYVLRHGREEVKLRQD